MARVTLARFGAQGIEERGFEMELEGLMREMEVADALGAKTRTLANWRCARKGPPFVKVGRRVFYRRDALFAWLRARERDCELGAERQPSKRGRLA